MRLFILAFALFFTHILGAATISISSDVEPEKFNPLYEGEHGSALGLIYSGLVFINDKGEFQNFLAESISVDANKKIYDIKIRPDVKFNKSGKKVTADDFIYTFNAVMDKANASSFRSTFSEVEKIEKTGELSIKVTLKSSYLPFMKALKVGVLNKDDVSDGTGFYNVKEYKKGQFIHLVPSGSTPKGIAAPADDVLINFIESEAGVVAALKAGSIDAAFVSPTQLVNFKDGGYNITRFASADYRALMFNANIFTDKRVRKALSTLVCRDELINVVLGGYGRTAFSPMTEFRNMTFKDCDKVGAEKLLKEAGYSKGKDGKFQKAGKTLKFDIVAWSTDSERYLIATYLRDTFQAFGVDAVLNTARSVDINKVDTFVIGFGSPIDPDFHAYKVFHSAYDTLSNDEGENYGHFKNAAVDKALTAARVGKTQKERSAKYEEFNKLMITEAPFAFLLFLDYALVTKNIDGISNVKVLGHHGDGVIQSVYAWRKK